MKMSDFQRRAKWMKLQRCLNSHCAHILRHLHLQGRFFHSYLHMICAHLQMQTTDLCGMIYLGKGNNSRKSSPAIHITQQATYTLLREDEEWKKIRWFRKVWWKPSQKVERNCKLLDVTRLIKTCVKEKYVQSAVEDKRSLQKIQINLGCLNTGKFFDEPSSTGLISPEAVFTHFLFFFQIHQMTHCTLLLDISSGWLP